MICKQTNTGKMFFSCSPALSAVDIYIWRDIWKNVALSVVSPGELSKFAGVHQCHKQAMGRDEEEGVHGSVGKGKPLIPLLKWLLPMLPGNWGPQNPPYGKEKPSDAGERPAALAHNPIASVVELRSWGSRSKTFLLPGNQAEERCGLVFFFPSLPLFGRWRWLTFWSSAMGSALQTAPCNSQGHRDAAHHPLPPKLFFSHPLTVLKMNASGSPGAEGGGMLGSPRGGGMLPGSLQEGAAAGSLKTGWCVTDSGFLAHAGKPQIYYRTIHQEGEGKQ